MGIQKKKIARIHVKTRKNMGNFPKSSVILQMCNAVNEYNRTVYRRDC